MCKKKKKKKKTVSKHFFVLEFPQNLLIDTMMFYMINY